MTTFTIVAVVDGSRHSIRALEWCAQQAPQLDARVVVVHAVQVPVNIGIGVVDRPVAVHGPLGMVTVHIDRPLVVVP